MSNRHLLLASLLVLSSSMPLIANAEIFKCVAANGELTFSQTPCVEKDTKVTVQKSVGTTSGNEPADCEHARRFALNTAQQMKSGTGSATIFDSYGGLDGLSRGSVSLISYVFQFRTNVDVSAERVSALATAKCQARSFGDVSCEQLPVSFTNRLGGCDEEQDSPGPLVVDDIEGMSAQHLQLQHSNNLRINGSSQEPKASPQASNRESKTREQEKRLQCRDEIKTQIASINKQMRGGYSSAQGESLKKRRRDLEAKMREC